MEIIAKSVERNLLLEFSGELDHHGARCAIEEAERWIDAALPKKLVVDFSSVTFMDSSGIAVLLRMQRRMQNLGGSIVICHIPKQAKRVLDAAGIGRLMPLQGKENEA